MKNRNPERRLAIVFAAVFLITALGWRWSSPVSAQESSFTTRVLVLHWYNREFSWNVEFDQSFKTYLGSAPAGNIEFYQEYLESDRFPGDNQAQLLRDYLRKKYADHPIDVVVATSDTSLEFLLKDRSSLFPGLPIVFVATQHLTTAEMMTEPGLTGIINISTHRRTVDLALSLHPATEQVFVISGTLEHDKRLERLAREELQGYEGRVQITYLTDLPPVQLVQKMKSLPKRSIVLYVWEQSKNEQGKLLESVDLFALIAPHAHVPIYGMLLPLIGRGVVGGYVNTGAAAGTKIAEIVLRLATGTRAVDIPVERAPAQPIFDWRELRRWGIPENKLPRESLVRFREATLWELYKWRILGIVVLLLGQTMLIWGLLIQRRKRRKLYTELQLSDAYLAESKAKLEEAQRITHVGYWEWDVLTGRVNWSDETYRIYGLRPQERPMDIATCQEKIHPEDWQRGMEEALGGDRFTAECRVFRPTGEVRIAHFQGDVKRDASGQPHHLFGTVQDITDRKRAEDKIREQERELRQLVDLVPQQVAVFGPGGERLYANHIALDYIGLSLEEWRQTPGNFYSSPFFHPDDGERLRADSLRARSDGSAYEAELRVRKRDGTYRWFLIRFNPLRDEQGQIMRWYVALTDIEDRKRAEEKLQLENAVLREEIDQTSMFEEIVGTSSALKNVLSRISKVAPSDSTVLITGETGTGKELVARAIHRRSRRSGCAFVSVNCAAIPRDLIASELFGHEKGAFTGALQRRLGRFEMADGGTIFLDEVGELSPDTQVALLRVLQEREFERVGGGQAIRVDVRVIAATNRDLKAAVANSAFRQDLFYRLNVFPIEVPPLRERKDDILMLVEYFVQRFATKGGKRLRSIDKKTWGLLQSYAWPGNIRELQNVIERSVLLSSGDVFSVDELWLSKETAVPASRVEPQPIVRGEVEPRSEREIIEAALAETRGRVSGPSGAAVRLGVAPSTLDSRIKALKIDKRRFKFA